MARSRNIKPGFFDNEILGELPALTRLLFIGLWCLADREGRLGDRPKRIKKELLGYDDITAEDVDGMLRQLEDNGFIIRYSINAEHYIQITNFLKHQNPHCNEKASMIPPPALDSEEGLGVGGTLPKNRRTGSTGMDDHVDHDRPATAVESIENNQKEQSTIQVPYKHSTSTVQLGLIPDSLNLIPDTFKTLSCVFEQTHGERGPIDDREEGLDVADKPRKERRTESTGMDDHVDHDLPVTTVEKVGEGIKAAHKGEEKKSGKNRSPSWNTAQTELERSFCLFWDTYPKRVGKDKCWAKWQKLQPDEELMAKIVDTLETWKKCSQWKRDGGQYVPHPLTWLNRGGWEDECMEVEEHGGYKPPGGGTTAGFHTTADY